MLNPPVGSMPSSRAGERDGAAWVDVALLVVAMLAVRCALFAVTGNESGDPDARALTGAVQHQSPVLITSGFWLPMQAYGIAALMALGAGPLMAGKLISIVSGVLVVVPFYALVRMEFDRRTALLAGVLFALYGLHAGLSVLVMTESTYVLCAVWALWWVVREMRRDEPRGRLLCGAAAVLAFGGMWRHEAWQLTGLLMLWLAIDPRTRRWVVPFALIGFSAFALWTLGNILAGHGALYALTGVAEQKEAEKAVVSHTAASNLLKWVWTFVESPGPLVSGLALVGAWFAVVRGRFPIALAVLALMMVAPYLLLSVVKTEWRPQQRYVVLTVVLALPYAAAAFWQLVGAARRVPVLIAALLVLTVIGQGLAFSRHSSTGLPVRDYAANDVAAWSWMSEHLEQTDAVVVEDLDWRAPGLILHSGRWQNKHAIVHGTQPPGAMLEAIRNVEATVVVLNARGSERLDELARLRPRELYRNADWAVYRIEADR